MERVTPRATTSTITSTRERLAALGWRDILRVSWRPALLFATIGILAAPTGFGLGLLIGVATVNLCHELAHLSTARRCGADASLRCRYTFTTLVRGTLSAEATRKIGLAGVAMSSVIAVAALLTGMLLANAGLRLVGVHLVIVGVIAAADVIVNLIPSLILVQIAGFAAYWHAPDGVAWLYALASALAAAAVWLSAPLTDADKVLAVSRAKIAGLLVSPDWLRNGLNRNAKNRGFCAERGWLKQFRA